MTKLIQAKLILSFIFIISLSNNFAQNNKETVESIKESVEAIHLDTSLKIVTLQNDEFLDNVPDGGGELTGFYKDDRIYRIYQSIGISNGVSIGEYYYRKNKLMYVREKFNSYVMSDSSSSSFDYTKINTTYKGNFYFDNGKMIDSNSTGSRFFFDDSPDIEASIKKESNDAFSLILNKIKSAPDIKK